MKIADLLADISPYPSVPFAALLAGIGQVAQPGCSVVALSSRDPGDFLAVLRRLNAQGFRASHAAIGPEAALWATRSRALGYRPRRSGSTPIGRQRLRSNAWPESAIAVLAACCLEAAWITLLYITVTALATKGIGPLSLVAFAVAAIAGLLLSRWIGEERRDRHRTLLAVIAIGVALAGWLVPLGVDAALVVDQPWTILEMHPAGLLLGLAFLRGTAHMTEMDDEWIAGIAIGRRGRLGGGDVVRAVAVGRDHGSGDPR